jgi:hypothetical protein
MIGWGGRIRQGGERVVAIKVFCIDLSDLPYQREHFHSMVVAYAAQVVAPLLVPVSLGVNDSSPPNLELPPYNIRNTTHSQVAKVSQLWGPHSRPGVGFSLIHLKSILQDPPQCPS